MEPRSLITLYLAELVIVGVLWLLSPHSAHRPESGVRELAGFVQHPTQQSTARR